MDQWEKVYSKEEKKGMNLVPIITAAVVILLILTIIALGYVKAPPDKAFIISGMHKNPKILVGRAGVKIPFIERVDKLYLGQMTVDIKTEQSVPTNDFINVNVDAVAKIRIGTEPEAIQLAAKNFLNKKPEEIAADLQDSLQGNMREIIGTLSLKSINTDRDSFSDQVMSKASGDMAKLGIEILSCNIQNVTDENNLIKDLGADNTSKIKKDASIAKAIAEKEIAIENAKADKEANDARINADLEISQKQRDLAIKQAELKQETDKAKAIADAAYEIERMEQQKAIETNTVNAQIAKAEREAELKQKEVLVKEQELAATIKKEADARTYQAEKTAEAQLIQRQKNAEAAKFEQERAAEAEKAKAEAKKYAAELEAEGIKAKYAAEAAGIAARGKAEAEAAQALGIAEAEAAKAKGLAEAEAMEKKAEAYKKYNGAAMAEMMLKIMPQMAAEIAKPLSSIDKINIYGGNGSDSGASQISGNLPVVMKQVFDTMSEATGVNFTEIMKANTYDAKVTKNINLNTSTDIADTIDKLTEDDTLISTPIVKAEEEVPAKEPFVPTITVGDEIQ
jgi:flotillin